MKIETQSKVPPALDFMDIRIGQVFRFNRQLYLKVRTKVLGDVHDAVVLTPEDRHGELTRFGKGGGGTYEIVDAKLVIED